MLLTDLQATLPTVASYLYDLPACNISHNHKTIVQTRASSHVMQQNTYLKGVIARDELVLQVNDSKDPVEVVMQVDRYKDFVMLVPGQLGMLGIALLLIAPVCNLSVSVHAMMLVSAV